MEEKTKIIDLYRVSFSCVADKEISSENDPSLPIDKLLPGDVIYTCTFCGICRIDRGDNTIYNFHKHPVREE